MKSSVLADLVEKAVGCFTQRRGRRFWTKPSIFDGAALLCSSLRFTAFDLDAAFEFAEDNNLVFTRVDDYAICFE
jgi:hypothetical protein